MEMSDLGVEERRVRVFVILAGFFLAAMALLNVVGLTRFIQLGPLSLAIGVLPYPLTFLMTDLISELYGRERANFVVVLGFAVNLFVFALLYFGMNLPAVATELQPPWQVLDLSASVALPNGTEASGETPLFTFIYACSAGSMMASMLSYLAAQTVDVQIFHYLKKKTKGKHLSVS